MKKKTATILAETRRDVPQGLGLIRNSTKRQDVERQHADLAWLEIRHGVQISKRLIIEGLSGKDTLHDPDVQRILNELADPQYAFLAISAIDRLVRPGEEDFTAYSIFQPFAALHKPIYSKREGIVEPWTPEGHDVCVEAGKKARSERLELRRRSMDEKLVLAKQGVQCSASAAYGYRFRKLAKRKGEWVIHEEEARVVREIFRRAAVLGWTGYKIADWLNGQKIPSATGGEWSAPVVRCLFYNPCYVGRARFAKDKAHECSVAVPAILTGEQAAWWDTVQVNRARNKERAGRPATHCDLSKRLFCGRCQHKMYGRRRNRRQRAYCCSHIDQYTHKRLCLAPQILCDLLDKAHWRTLTTRLRVADTVLSMFEDYRRKQAENQPKLGASDEKQLAKLERDEEATMMSLNDGDLTKFRDKIKKRLLEIQAEIAILKRKKERSAKVTPMPSRDSVEEYCAALADALDWDREDRLGFIERTVTRVTYADGEFTVEGRILLEGGPIKSGVQNRYSCLRTDAQRQGQNGDNGEPGRMRQPSQDVF
jgi:hypothetical protein